MNAKLFGVVARTGDSLPTPTVQDYTDAIQLHIDSTAQARSYADGVALSSYVSSTHAGWAVEATAFVAWRDAVWTYALTQFSAVRTGSRPAPTIATLLGELPTITWPS